MMIRNEKYIISAVTAKIIESVAYRKYALKQDQSSRVFWMDNKAIADQLIKRARSKSKIPDPDDFLKFLDNVWNKRFIRFSINYNRSNLTLSYICIDNRLKIIR